MTKFVGTILKVINIFVVLAYLSACLIPILPAGKFWMVASLGLVFPLLFIIVTAFLAGWAIARSKWVFLSLTALLLSWQQLGVVAGLRLNNDFDYAKTANTLRVLSWNTSSWGETSKNADPYKSDLPEMLATVKKQQADILCFQEFTDKRVPWDKYSNIRSFKEMGFPYYYYVKTVMGNVSYNLGVIIFSRYPITDTAKFTYGDADAAEHLIYTDIQFNQQKIRVFTTHLQSVRFDTEEYSTLRKIKRNNEKDLQGSKTIVRKIKYAYQFRVSQAALVQQKIKESPYPVIICGDFNDVPNSYTYFTIKGNLQDAFLQKGRGLGRTFQYLSPTLRIDYIMADKKFETTQFKRVIVPYSDHYPVVADFQYQPGH